MKRMFGPSPRCVSVIPSGPMRRAAWMAEAKNLHDVVARPLLQPAIIKAKFRFQRQRPRTRPFAWTTDPQARTGGRVQCLATNATVAENTICTLNLLGLRMT